MISLKTLKEMNAKQQSNPGRLYEAHPLTTSSEEIRLRYLAAIVLVIAMDREPKPKERQAFIELAASMSIGVEEAEEQLRERDSVTESDVATIFSMIKGNKLHLTYLLDAIWMFVADGHDVKKKDMEVIEEVNQLLSALKPEFLYALHLFADSLRSRGEATTGKPMAKKAAPKGTYPNDFPIDLLPINSFTSKYSDHAKEYWGVRTSTEESTPDLEDTSERGVARKPASKVAAKKAAAPAKKPVLAKKPVATPSTAATPGLKSSLNPAAAWPFPSGSRPS